MILEGIVTTLGEGGEVHIAPMGPTVDDSMERLLLRPFATAQTFHNLRRHGEGVFHVTDDVLLLARAAVGPVIPPPQARLATRVRGFILTGACRYYEFRVVSFDESEQRVRIDAEIVYAGRLRDFVGFNRAKHAVVEAAILATRTHLLSLAEIDAEYRKLDVIVQKTGGPQEREAFAFLERHVHQAKSAAAQSGGLP